MNVNELERAGGTVLAGGTGVELHGWRFEAARAPAMGTQEKAELRTRLHAELAEPAPGPPPPLPEQVFHRSTLTLTHASGFSISFGAESALRRWMAGSAAHGANGVQVAAAADPIWRRQAQQLHASDELATREYDWTYSTDYACEPTTAAWAAHAGAGIDYEALKDRSVPILFFAEVPLYHDDCGEHGESALTARLRVMPDCFFVLLRHHLRVDGVVVKQRDARFFHRFGAAAVLREQRLAEAPLPPLPSRADAEAVVTGAASAAPAPADAAPPAPARGGPSEQAASEQLAAVTPTLHVVEESAVGA